MRKARLLRSFLRREPVHCTWQLSPRCESFCHFCEHRAESAREEVELAECVRIAENLAQRGSLLVSLTGSEPFLRSDLPAVVASLARWHFPLLVTNGWLVTRENAQQVWRAGLEVASVAFEHAEAERHDALAGMAGAHTRAVAALGWLAEGRVRRTQKVNVRIRLREDTLEGLPVLLRLAAGHGATVSLEAPFPLPLAAEAGDLQARLRDLRRRHGNLRTGGHVLEGLGRALTGGVGGCLAGRAFFNVDHRGRVSRCLEYRPPQHQLGTAGVDRWIEVLRRLRDDSARNDCRACFYASRAEIETLYTVRGFVGGLRALVSA